jgi:hypothetical protein
MRSTGGSPSTPKSIVPSTSAQRTKIIKEKW